MDKSYATVSFICNLPYLGNCVWYSRLWHTEAWDEMVRILQVTFSNAFCSILIQISLKYITQVPININPPLGLIIAWRQTGDMMGWSPGLSMLNLPYIYSQWIFAF